MGKKIREGINQREREREKKKGFLGWLTCIAGHSGTWLIACRHVLGGHLAVPRCRPSRIAPSAVVIIFVPLTPLIIGHGLVGRCDCLGLRARLGVIVPLAAPIVAIAVVVRGFGLGLARSSRWISSLCCLIRPHSRTFFFLSSSSSSSSRRCFLYALLILSRFSNNLTC